jgi:chromate transporter
MVVAISVAYISYGGLWWMQALFYAIGATVIAIIAIAAYKLARSSNKRDPLFVTRYYGLFSVGSLSRPCGLKPSWLNSLFLPGC